MGCPGHGDVVQAAWLTQQPQIVDQGLGTADRERRHHHRTTALHRAGDHVAKRLDRVRSVMAAITVGGFDDDIVGRWHRFGIVHDVSP